MGALCFQFGVPEENFLKFLLVYFLGVCISSYTAAFTILDKYFKPVYRVQNGLGRAGFF